MPPKSETFSKKIKKVGKYELGVTLGQGTFGKVKMAIERPTDGIGSPRNYAIKLLDKNKIRQAGLGAQIKKEVRFDSYSGVHHIVHGGGVSSLSCHFSHSLYRSVS